MVLLAFTVPTKVYLLVMSAYSLSSINLKILKEQCFQLTRSPNSSCTHVRDIQDNILLFRPNLVGEELYTQLFFFVQSIFADRYIHGTGL